jgi:sialate O-acetylesterase
MKKSIGLIVMSLVLSAYAEIKLPNLIADNMVLQSGKANLWGWAAPGEAVEITASWGASASVTADDKGRWKTQIQVPAASFKSYTITFKGTNTITVKNVLAGEVWFCSGQSNMSWPLKWTKDHEEEIKNANYPMIRLFTVPRLATGKLQENCKGTWEVCSSSTIGEFSAVGYFFAREINREMKIPVGMIHSSWGGTGIESWMDTATAVEFEHAAKAKARSDKEQANFDFEGSAAKLKELQDKDKEAAFNKQYRKDYAEWKKNKKGRPPLNLFGLKYQLTPPLQRQHYVSNLYMNMIYPAQNYTIKGILWYQGESNTGSSKIYAKMLVAMISAWRKQWGQGDFPFISAQLPNYMKAWKEDQAVGLDDRWPVLRQAFVDAAKMIPEAYYTVNIDIGEAKTIHPRNKQDVGKRFALMAMKNVYKRDVGAWGGPTFKSAEFEAGKAIVKFDTKGAALAVRDNATLFGFALAGDDGKYVRADARIIGDDTVEVSSPIVKKAFSVAYAWANNPEGANLINKAGFPAEPLKFGKFTSARLDHEKFTYVFKGEASGIVNDPASQNKKVGWMKGDKAWTLRCNIPDNLSRDYKYNIKVACRVERGADNATFRIGVCDPKTRNIVANKNVSPNDLKSDQYMELEMPAVKLSDGMYVFIGGMAPKDPKNKIFIDYIDLQAAEKVKE